MRCVKDLSSLSLSLSCLTQLRVLSLSRYKVGPLKSLQVLSQLGALRFAGLKQLLLEADQLQTLGSALPGLQYLMITECVIVQEQTPEATPQFETSEEELSQMPEARAGVLTPPHPQPFGAFSYLRLLRLNGSRQRVLAQQPQWQPLLPCLMQLPYLRFLDLAGFSIDLDELDNVPRLTQLHYLNLAQHQLGAGASHKLQDARFVVMSGARQMFDELIEEEVINQVR
eukprot:jgi/Chrzof1/1157/Cz01g42200.t1